jgi:molybdate transport system substrate-binding protein
MVVRKLRYLKYIGYNQLALFVQKGNPLQIKGLDDLVRNDLLVVVGNPETCSIGKVTEETILRYKGKAFLEKVKYNISSYAADSRDMNQMFMKKRVELGLNWIATSRFPDNRGIVDTISLFELFSPRKSLILATLKFSKYPEIAQAFIDYVVSPEGQKIMGEYGFIDE